MNENSSHNSSSTNTIIICSMENEISSNASKPLLDNDSFCYDTFANSYFEQPSLESLMPNFGHEHYR